MAHSHTIVVAVNSAPASLEALALACTAAKQRKSKIYGVHVIEVARSLPLNAELEADARKAEQVLRKAEQAAAAMGSTITGELLQARDAGQAIVDEALDKEADVIVLGVPAGSKVGESRLGRTASFVLKHAACDVWLVRQGTSKTRTHDEEEHGR